MRCGGAYSSHFPNSAVDLFLYWGPMFPIASLFTNATVNCCDVTVTCHLTAVGWTYISTLQHPQCILSPRHAGLIRLCCKPTHFESIWLHHSKAWYFCKSSFYEIEKVVAAFQCNIHSDFRNPYLIYGAKSNGREFKHFVLHQTISFGVSAI